MKIPKLYRAFYIVLDDVDFPCAGYNGFSYGIAKHLVKVRRVRCDFSQGWKLQLVSPKNFTEWDKQNHYLSEWCLEAFSDEDDYGDCGYLDLSSYKIARVGDDHGNAINFYM